MEFLISTAREYQISFPQHNTEEWPPSTLMIQAADSPEASRHLYLTIRL